MNADRFRDFCLKHGIQPIEMNASPADIFRSLAEIAMIAAASVEELNSGLAELNRQLGRRAEQASTDGRPFGSFGWTRGETRPLPEKPSGSDAEPAGGSVAYAGRAGSRRKR